MTIYLITSGEYSDYDHEAIIEVDGPLDLPALEAEYRQAIAQQAPPKFGQTYYSDVPPYKERVRAWHTFEPAHFVDWLIANHGARRLVYTELNVTPGRLTLEGSATRRYVQGDAVNVAGMPTIVSFDICERKKHGND